ncbi:hypothetical protein RJ639_023480 [Escallonia herrerae]|uniref:Uncharacterized protein n=1 Tax=Escallonia herrerae TaxID=1293975 RepID=A0AA88UYV0_9ASTE|nr:hypothetical protein RJ639_023480 [Escallonia herrerae]
MVNGLACKDPKLVQANDFFFSGLHLTGNTSNAVGSQVRFVTSNLENRLITKRNNKLVNGGCKDCGMVVLAGGSCGIVIYANGVHGS